MTKTAFEQKLRELTSHKDFVDVIRRDCLTMFVRGQERGWTDEYEENMVLPEIILTAAIQNAISRYRPLWPGFRRKVGKFLKLL